jgi:hypothetical protein
MSVHFLTLPIELRNRVYELCLVHQEPFDPWIEDSDEPQELTLGLLRVNKRVYHEASHVFYAYNGFNFSMGTSQDIASFLVQIGRNNAESIRHISVDFPQFVNLEAGDVTLDDNSTGILINIQSSCPNLSTLTTSRYSSNAVELRLDALDHFETVAEALLLVDSRLRSISSLQKIIVEVYEDGPSDGIRKEMQSHGWTISAAEYAEDWVTDKSSSEDEEAWGSDSRDGTSDDVDFGNEFGRNFNMEMGLPFPMPWEWE